MQIIAGEKNSDGSAMIDENNNMILNSIDLDGDGTLSVKDVTELQVYIAKNT